MVDLKEIREILKKLGNNFDKLKYLNELLEKIKDKELKKNVKDLIKDIKEIEAITQIETKGRVEWSDTGEEAPQEERRLEKQVVGVPIVKEEEKESKKIEYTLGHNTNPYRDGTGGGNIKYEESNKTTYLEGGKTFIEGKGNEQYLGEDINKSHEDIMGEMGGQVRYRSLEGDSVDYAPASVSQEVHGKAKKKHSH